MDYNIWICWCWKNKQYLYKSFHHSNPINIYIVLFFLFVLLVVDFSCRPSNKRKRATWAQNKTADRHCRPHETKKKKKIVLCEKADQPGHCPESQWHRSSMGYKGSPEPTAAAATVLQKLAGTMGKVRLPFFLPRSFCASAYLRGLFS